MALLNNQTIFNLLITLIIGAALYYYIKYKFRVLELTQREHAKVLQSVIMSMNNTPSSGSLQRYNSTNASGMNELPDIGEDINRFNNINGGELINVSDDDDSEEEDDSESGSDSDGGSDSDSDGSSDGGSDGDDDEHPSNSVEYDSHNTKKIIIGGNVESQMIEHLTGPDVKVIELSHPLYPSHDNGEDDNNDEDDDEDDDDDDDDEDSNDDNENDNDNSSNNVNGTEYLEKYKEDDIKNNAANVATEANEANVEDSNFSITAVFKPKESDTNPDLNSMNVQGLRQLLKQRLASDGKQMSETSINKLAKKDLIKQLHQ
jgi:hypothetical protein